MHKADLETVFKNFYKICDDLAEFINTHEKELLQILTRYETHEAACDEISRSVKTLRGMPAEMSAIDQPLQNLNIATIFPLNLPLYSLVIFGIAPSVFAKNIFIRPPEVMKAILAELWVTLDIERRFPAISLKPTPRQAFVQLYAAECDVIIFTGKYENALDIYQECPYSLLIYNGSGVNPFILFADADISLAARKAVEMRCFNSGQDCAGPDAFFVPNSLADEFIQKLESGLKEIKVGDTRDPEVRVGPTMKETYINELQDWLKREQSNVVFGGKIDAQRHLVYPTIVREQIDKTYNYEFHEFFAPYFYVLTYDRTEELEYVLASKSFRERGMYISVFGNNRGIEASLTFVQVLKNTIVNDVEQGNEQYGGFGSQANFLLYGNEKIIHPVLISRDMHQVITD